MPLSNCASCFSTVNLKYSVDCKDCKKPIHEDCSVEGYCDTCYTVRDTERPTMFDDVELPDIVRRSHIEQYKKCPFSLYLSLKNGVLRHNNETEDESESSIYAQLGIDLHQLFEDQYKESLSKDQSVERFHQVWYTYKPELFDDESQKDKLYERALRCIDTFYDVLPELQPHPFEMEQNIIFEISPDLPQVSITMDRIDMVDGELEMIDWKTGKVMVGKKHATDLQAPLYIYAVKQKYNLPVRRFTFYYLDERKERIFERVNDDTYACAVRGNVYIISLTESIREVKQLFGRINNREFNIPSDVRAMYYTCKMCDHRKSGACQGADEQSWSNINMSYGV